jgi:cytokinesis protein
MDSLFGRKRPKGDRDQPKAQRVPSLGTAELSAHAVPYDKLAPSARPPIPISAPITNPTLTATGTEFNIHQIQKARADRERTYALANGGSGAGAGTRQSSPAPSTSTGDSAFYSDGPVSSSSASTMTAGSSRTSSAAAARRTRQSSASATSSRRSPSGADFPSGAGSPHSTPPSAYPPTPTAGHRPMSGATARSDSNRSSRYAPSFTSADSHAHHPHTQQLAQALGLREPGGFHFPRPERDEEIEAMFEDIKAARDVSGRNMTLEQKWTMVHSAAQLRWEEERKRAAAQARARTAGEAGGGGGPPASQVVNAEGMPGWYIMKFLDKTITAKQAQGLAVSLRSMEITWLREFIELSGTSVLAQAIFAISRKGSQRCVFTVQCVCSLFSYRRLTQAPGRH